MAKWGEGDPRWIVEERPDAANPNNWHWTEKNASPWSRERIKDLLDGLKVETEEGCCQISEVSKIEGEACANNRKGKLIFFYEWEVTAEWSGFLNSDPKTKYKGKLEVPNLSDENDASELDVSVTVTSTKDDAHKVKEIMWLKGSELVKEQLGKYIKDLKTEFSQGMILPTKNQGNDNAANDNTVKPVETQNKTVKKEVKKTINQPILKAVQAAGLGVKIPTKILTMTEQFQCSPADLYRALTVQDMVQAFTREALSVFEVKKGGRFVLFNGNVSGEFTDLVPGEKISMRWRRNDWPKDHYSDVKMEISLKLNQTELKLTQTGVPASHFDSTKDGWSQYYWFGIKHTFGYDPKLF
ncbi:activator of 90 kDa heat shock protein ATPase homolog 1-like [Lineus longissimus]|uniref:activator of 90 kDa heat shock protein ATPase homolog 1-like n=1 Tax=Lineus longissimus TaxID=88925 RepID=UPI002B4D787F